MIIENKYNLAMTSHSSGNPRSIPEPFSVKTRQVYQSPMLTLLEDYNIATGASNVPEGSNGLLS